MCGNFNIVCNFRDILFYNTEYAFLPRLTACTV